MRAPDTAARGLARRHVGARVQFSAAHWQAIADSLTAAGVNADVIAAEMRLIQTQCRWSLRAEIQSLALTYSLRSHLDYARRRSDQTPTPRELRTKIAELDAACSVAARYLSLDIARALKAVRERAEQELQERLAAPKRPRRPAAAKPRHRRHAYTEYLTKLAPLWMRIVPNAARRRDKHFHLRAFLRACLAPVFPTVLRDPRTGKRTDNALDSFTDRYFRRIAS
jgi:hypothetical protein